jgi:hypothetical protein
VESFIPTFSSSPAFSFKSKAIHSKYNSQSHLDFLNKFTFRVSGWLKSLVIVYLFLLIISFSLSVFSALISKKIQRQIHAPISTYLKMYVCMYVCTYVYKDISTLIVTCE